MDQPNSLLAILGQIAAFILILELLVYILLAVVLNGVFAIAFTWIREQAELIKKLRPVVDSVNSTTEAAIKGTLPAASANENKIVRAVAQIPAQANAIEGKIEQGTDRVANAMIELRARTVMVQGIARALFLPDLSIRQQRLPAPKSPEVRALPVGEGETSAINQLSTASARSSEISTSAEAGEGRVDLAAPGSQPGRSTGT